MYASIGYTFFLNLDLLRTLFFIRVFMVVFSSIIIKYSRNLSWSILAIML